jgi:hypothetical protein
MNPQGWKRRFDDPIPLPDGSKPLPDGQLITLEDAGSYITMLPKADQQFPEWQAAIESLMLLRNTTGQRCSRASAS